MITHRKGYVKKDSITGKIFEKVPQMETFVGSTTCKGVWLSVDRMDSSKLYSLGKELCAIILKECDERAACTLGEGGSRYNQAPF